MSSDPIRDYLTAFRAYEAASKEAETLAYATRKLAEMLLYWGTIEITHVPGVAFPAGASKGKSMSANDWPTAEKLATTFALAHDLRHALIQAWNAVPEQERGGLRGLPDAPR